MAQKTSKNEKNSKNSYTIYDDHTTGTVEIADEVISTIAALAATEVEGVASIIGNITHEKAARAGSRALSRGIKIRVEDKEITVSMVILMQYAYSIPETTRKVQEKVKNTLETMTGLSVREVNVSVADVAAK